MQQPDCIRAIEFGPSVPMLKVREEKNS